MREPCRHLLPALLVAATIAGIAGTPALGAPMGPAATTGMVAKALGDCTLNSRLDRTLTNPAPEYRITANGNVSCRKKHGSTSLTVRLVKDGATWASASGSWKNAFGTGTTWLTTPARYSSPSQPNCGWMHSAVTVTINDLGTATVATPSTWTCYR